MIVNACKLPYSNISFDEYSYRLVASVSKLKGLSNRVIGNSFTVSTKTKKNPAKILNFTWGNIIRKYVVDDLLPINLDASSIDLPIFSIPESKELFDRAISLIVKAKDKPSNVVDSERAVKRSK